MKDHQSLVNHYRSLKASIGVFRSDSSSILTGAYIYSKGRLKKESFSLMGGCQNKNWCGQDYSWPSQNDNPFDKMTIRLTKRQSV